MREYLFMFVTDRKGVMGEDGKRYYSSVNYDDVHAMKQ